MATRTVEESSLTIVADAIRARAGTSDKISFPDGYANKIAGIGMASVDEYIKGTMKSVYSEVGSGRNHMFIYCSKLQSVNMPNLEYTSGSGFGHCTSLVDVNVPKLWKVSIYGFEYCSALTMLNLPKLTEIASNGFYNCSSLKTLVFRMNQVVSLENLNAFNGTPFASGGTGGTVYCHAAQIQDYQTATNWSTLYAAGTCNFVAIEGSEYE